MIEAPFHTIPVSYSEIARATEAIGFTMASDLHTGSLLKTLVASKPAGRFLELGTGTGLATSWILDGMDKDSLLVTVENEQGLQQIAQKELVDSRIEFVLADAYRWITGFAGEPFDLIFADAMPGKYDLFDETVRLLKKGGIYLIDDMLPQPNWPEGHAERVAQFVSMLEKRQDFVLTKLRWSTGIIIATKLVDPLV